MEYTRIHRLLRLITLIQGSGRLNAAKLAEICETSQRNIYRDIKELEGAGVPVTFDEESGGYRIGREFFLRPVDFALEEAMAIIQLNDADPAVQRAGEVVMRTVERAAALDRVRALAEEGLRAVAID